MVRRSRVPNKEGLHKRQSVSNVTNTQHYLGSAFTTEEKWIESY